MIDDTEQLRRDVEQLQEFLRHAEYFDSEDGADQYADAIAALNRIVARVEQAERERDELGPFFVRDCCRILGVDELDYLRLDTLAARLREAAAAERERDEALRRLSATVQSGTRAEVERNQAEARLASVPALVEALRLARRDIQVVQRAGWDSTRLRFATEALNRIEAALVVYEQSQGNA